MTPNASIRQYLCLNGVGTIGTMSSADTQPDRNTPELDPVIAAYMSGVDRTLLRENLKLTVEQRFEKMRGLQRVAEELRRAGQQARNKS